MQVIERQWQPTWGVQLCRTSSRQEAQQCCPCQRGGPGCSEVQQPEGPQGQRQWPKQGPRLCSAQCSSARSSRWSKARQQQTWWQRCKQCPPCKQQPTAAATQAAWTARPAAAAPAACPGVSPAAAPPARAASAATAAAASRGSRADQHVCFEWRHVCFAGVAPLDSVRSARES